MSPSPREQLKVTKSFLSANIKDGKIRLFINSFGGAYRIRTDDLFHAMEAR